nr:hypothetical protein [Tanacetum cinerariifolium]
MVVYSGVVVVAVAVMVMWFQYYGVSTSVRVGSSGGVLRCWWFTPVHRWRFRVAAGVLQRLKENSKRTKSEQNGTKTGSVAKPGNVKCSYSR